MDEEAKEHLNKGNIILFPEFEKIKEEVQKLRTEISMLQLEHDELLYVECKNIEMMYMLALGGLEYKLYELNCKLSRLKRKVELIQQRKNRQEKIILSDIEAILDSEFADYQARLNEQIEKMNAAMQRSNGKFLSEDEAKEIKKLYRNIVKTLHPDLNPDISAAQMTLFQNAVSAYEKGDLDSLRIISEMVADDMPDTSEESSLGDLIKEKDRLSELLRVVQERIAKIKSEYPYTVKELVSDEKKVAANKAELEAEITQVKEVLSAYKARIEEMLR